MRQPFSGELHLVPTGRERERLPTDYADGVEDGFLSDAEPFEGSSDTAAILRTKGEYVKIVARITKKVQWRTLAYFNVLFLSSEVMSDMVIAVNSMASVSQKHKITVILEEDQFERFEAYCERNGYKKSTLICRLIRQHLDNEHFSIQRTLSYDPEAPK